MSAASAGRTNASVKARAVSNPSLRRIQLDFEVMIRLSPLFRGANGKPPKLEREDERAKRHRALNFGGTRAPSSLISRESKRNDSRRTALEMALPNRKNGNELGHEGALP
jgi:hypothetical protein